MTLTIPTTHIEILRAMLDNGRKEEAIAWLKAIARFLPAEELAQLQQMALDAQSKRKRGGGGRVRDEFADMSRELAFANTVQSKIHCGDSLEVAVANAATEGVGDPGDPAKRIYKSESAVRGYYRKWKVLVKLNEPPFD